MGEILRRRRGRSKEQPVPKMGTGLGKGRRGKSAGPSSYVWCDNRESAAEEAEKRGSKGTPLNTTFPLFNHLSLPLPWFLDHRPSSSTFSSLLMFPLLLLFWPWSTVLGPETARSTGKAAAAATRQSAREASPETQLARHTLATRHSGQQDRRRLAEKQWGTRILCASR